MEARVSGFDVASANFRQSQAACRYSSTMSMGLPLISPIPEVGQTKKRFFPFPLQDKILIGHETGALLKTILSHLGYSGTEIRTSRLWYLCYAAPENENQPIRGMTRVRTLA